MHVAQAGRGLLIALAVLAAVAFGGCRSAPTKGWQTISELKVGRQLQWYVIDSPMTRPVRKIRVCVYRHDLEIEALRVRVKGRREPLEPEMRYFVRSGEHPARTLDEGGVVVKRVELHARSRGSHKSIVQVQVLP